MLPSSRQALQRLRLILAPPETLRDHVLRFSMWAAHVLRREGPVAVLRQAYLNFRTWRHEIERITSLPREPIAYPEWLAENEPGPAELDRQRQTAQGFAWQPVVSLVTVVSDSSVQHLENMINSVLSQTYSHWELWLGVRGPESPALSAALAERTGKDHRIRVQSIEPAWGLFEGPGRPWQNAGGEFILRVGANDRLAPDLLYEVVSLLNDQPEADLIYWDEDQLSPEGARQAPWFKPDWSPELLLSVNYLSPAAIRRAVLQNIGSLADGEALDWDLSFRCAEQTGRIHHIPKVLYHRRPGAGLTASSPDEPLRAIEAHLRRSGVDEPHACVSGPAGVVRVSWPTARPKVSVIIPTKNQVRFLRKCLTSLLENTAYSNFEVIVVDNQSGERQTLNYYKAIRSDPRVRIVEYSAPFNFSAANNLGARHATGDYLLFLNNDTEALEPDWLEELVRWAERPQVGVVGAKLLYPGGTVQHAGVVMGMEGHSSHVFSGAPEGYCGPFGSVEWYRNYNAVTAACMMMRREVFDRVGGFDEEYLLVFSDVEICLRALRQGYRVVYTPFVRLRHHEGRSRANQMPMSDLQRGYVHMRQMVEAGDPYYNPNLSYSERLPTFARRGEESRMARLRRLVGMEAGSACAGLTRQAHHLPYQQVLSTAGASGQVLHREEIYGSGPPNTAANPEVLALILRYSQAPILDVGCGIGVYMAAIRGRGLAVCGLEVNPDYVKRAKARGLDVQLYDGRAFPYPAGGFDTAIAIEVLEHLPDWEHTLHEMLRVTRRCVLLSVPNIGVIPALSRHRVVPWHLLEASHVNFFTAEILSRRLSRVSGTSSHVFTYGAFQINGETYHNHIFAVIHKTPGPEDKSAFEHALASGN